MNELACFGELHAMTSEQDAFMRNVLDVVKEEEEKNHKDGNPCEVPTGHFLHAGCYARTCIVPEGGCLVGTLIKIPTVVIVSGDCLVTVGDKYTRLVGYHVLKGEANRRQCFVANKQTHVTMLFATDLQDLGKCEEAFTDEFENLMTRRSL